MTIEEIKDASAQTHPSRQHPWAIFLIFLRLGLTSFGGPVAHLGYFRQEFVVRRKWLDEHAYADLVSLCQFLPGPASSQVGIALGLLRGGMAGALASWLGFTLPSAILLVLFGLGLSAAGGEYGNWLHGLKIAAVAVVAALLVFNIGDKNQILMFLPILAAVIAAWAIGEVVTDRVFGGHEGEGA